MNLCVEEWMTSEMKDVCFIFLHFNTKKKYL